MRLFADENVEPQVVEALRSLGHDVLCVGECMTGAADDKVLACAAAGERILVTSDKDFGELAFRLGHLATGILLLRLGTEAGAEKARTVSAVLPKIAHRLAGNMVVVTDMGVRLRALRPT